MSYITKPGVLDESYKESQQETNAHLAAIAKALGGDASGHIKNFAMLQTYVRLGTIGQYLSKGDAIKVSKESSISATLGAGNTGTAAVVVSGESTFLAKVGSSETHTYEFVSDGTVWSLDGESITPAEYGLTITGTPAANDTFAVTVQADAIIFDVLGTNDFDVPVNSTLEHTLPLISRDILSYGVIAQNPPQALKAIAADEFANGMPAGTYNITLDHGAYNNDTGQDGTFQFTTTQAVPVGGKIKHTKIGVYESDGQYTKAKILAGTFTTYDADYNVIESGLVTTEGNSGTSLGTCTAEDPTYMSGTHLNSTRRQGQGSNRGSHSNIRKWANSDAAGAAAGAIASWWYPSDEFDMPPKTTIPGFKHGLDPEFVACICPVRKRTYLHVWDQNGETYEDTDEEIFQLSMTELGYGNNNSVDEGSPKGDGNINKAGAYPLYDGATNADRIKRQNGTARYWFHRSPNPSYASIVRSSSTDGSLNSGGANYTNGAVLGLCIG